MRRHNWSQTLPRSTAILSTCLATEAIRRTSRRILKKQGKSWLNLFPNGAITKKSDGARMGKGKGNHKA